jgi:SNF2 family DNA or RNA helicase
VPSSTAYGGAASDRLRSLLAAEGGNPTREPRARAKTPLPPPPIDAELWIKTADPADLPPPPIKTKPWAHQVRAFNWALPKKAAYLAMAPGAGKSAITVALAAGRAHRRVLIICPKSVIAGWPSQFKQHGTHDVLAVALDKGTVAKRVETAQQCLDLAQIRGQQAVVVVNYEAVPSAAMQAFIRAANFDFVVADELHKCKSASGLISKTVHQLFRGRDIHRLGLSGTPLPHSPLDAWGQMRFLDETAFGGARSWTQFRLRYSRPNPMFPSKVDEWINQQELSDRLAPYMLQVGYDALDLPTYHHVVREVELGQKTRALYRELEKEFYAEVETGEITAANALTRLLRLQQVAAGFVTQDDRQIIEVGDEKRDMLHEVIEALPTGEPIVVFARFRHDLDVIASVTKALGLRYGEVSGRRNDLVESRMPSGIDVLGAQLQAGGVGVDLTRASFCCYFNLGFSLSDYVQSLARTHRPGQTRHVTYFHLVSKGTVDERVYRALDERRDVVSAVMERV